MTDDGYDIQVSRRLADPSEAEHAELAQLRERFRSHHIFCDAGTGRGIRYVAHGAVSGVRPHTIITDDLAELREELEQAAPGELGAQDSAAVHRPPIASTSPKPSGAGRVPLLGLRRTACSERLASAAWHDQPTAQSSAGDARDGPGAGLYVSFRRPGSSTTGTNSSR